VSHIHTLSPEQVAQEIIEQAKYIIAEELKRGLTVVQKTDNTPVTQIDTRINDFALEFIGRHFPSDAIYAEEGSGGPGTTGYTWVIDPIDGTRALELGMPTYTVCIARVAPDGQPDFSLVYNPSTNDRYVFRRGEKATKNGKELRVKQAPNLRGEKVYVSSRMPTSAVQSAELSARVKQAGAEQISTHSLAFGVLLVAEGAAAAAISGVKEPYELASVKPMVEAGGGIVVDLNGHEIMRCDGTINGLIVAANRHILEEMLELGKAALAPDKRLEIIRRHMPQVATIQAIKSGYVNDVYIVDEQHVFRFPKNEASREILLFEVEVLRKLEGHTRLAVPIVEHVESDGSWAQFSYIQGKQYDPQTIRSLTQDEKTRFASDIAKFLFDMNAVVPREWMKAAIAGLPINRKDDATYYTELLELGRKNNNPYVQHYHEYHERLMRSHREVFTGEEIVIHGDLHSGNFVFNEENQLTGIYDFGDAMLHTVYFELRQMYQFGDDVVEMMIAALGGRFGPISKESVRILAITHELSILMRLGSSEETPYDEDRSAIAKRLLKEWGELVQ
jgi:fructose-1,6-bisphosphatase/inositol monophosphatase family enzyme/aminoglycoside phosphotransferase (APT) family kinase protein